jgi:hypothetical protein
METAMKRTYIQEQRYGHHERASAAERVQRFVRRLTAPAKLLWLARQERNADEHMADLAASREYLTEAMKRVRLEQVRIEERRRLIHKEFA